MVKLHRRLEEVFAAWDRAGLTWCLLRIPTQPLAPTGDVDLLVDPAHALVARRILGRLGFQPLPGWGYGSDAFFLGRDPRTGVWLWLHVVRELTFGPYQALRAPAAAECLARRRRAGRVAVLAEEDAFWALLAHCLLDKRRVPAHHRRTLRALAPAASDLGGALPRALEPLCPAGWDPAHLVQATLAGDWPALEALAPALVAACLCQHPLGQRRALAVRAARWAARARGLVHLALWRRYWSRRWTEVPA